MGLLTIQTFILDENRKKQLQRDISRTKHNNQKSDSDISSRTRSKTENPRNDELSSGNFGDSFCHGVTSPDVCDASVTEFMNSSSVLCYSPDPPSMHNDINTAMLDSFGASVSLPNNLHRSADALMPIENSYVDPVEYCSLPDIELSESDIEVDQRNQSDCQSPVSLLDNSDSCHIKTPSNTVSEGADSDSSESMRREIRLAIRESIRNSGVNQALDSCSKSLANCSTKKKKKTKKSDSQDKT